MGNYIRESFHNFIIDKFDKIYRDNRISCNILDIGCWDGSFLLKLKERGYSNLHGIDQYFDMKNTDIDFSKQDINHGLLFDDNSFDAIFLLDVIEHVPNQFYLFDEINRVLKKGGLLIISTPNITSIIGKINFIVNDTLHGFGKGQVIDQYLGLPGHISPFIPNIFLDYYSDKFHILNKYYFGIIIPVLNKFIKISSKYLSGNLILILQKKGK